MGDAKRAGCLIVLEGGDGVGKTTQWRRLHERLAATGTETLALREPGGTSTGDALRALLLDPASPMAPATEALLFAASRAQLIAETVRPALARDATVLLDRFLLSTYAYQGAGRGLPLPALRAINGTATGGLTPDLTLLLTMPLDDAILRIQSRGARDRIDGEEQGFHARVHRAFADACDPAWQAAHPEIGPVAAVDATGTEDAVTARCLGELRRRWPARFDALVESTHG